MSKLVIDSEKIRSAGENIIKASEKFNTTYNEMFAKLCDISNNGTWQGGANSAAEKWVSHVSSEKQQYSDYAVSINNFGKQLIEYADGIDSVAAGTIGEGLCQ